MTASQIQEIYDYQIDRQLLQAEERVLTAFKVLEEQIINYSELTYFDVKTRVGLQTKLAKFRGEYLGTVCELPKRTFVAETAEEVD